MNQLLKGITILDFGRFIAGPLCASLMGDLGAEVIRIDKLGGNEDRFVLNSNNNDGAVYLAVNRNKKSVSINIATSVGRVVLTKLIETCDVVVANMPDSYLKALGIDYESLKLIKHDIILASINGFGYSSNNVAFDGIAQFLTGVPSITGIEGQPQKCAAPYIDYSTGISCAYGILAALLYRNQTGLGQHIHCSLVGTGLMIASVFYVQEDIFGLTKRPCGNKAQYGGPIDLFETSDGKIFIAVGGNIQFKRWTVLMGKHELYNDPRFSTDNLRGENQTILCEITSQWCKCKSTKEAFELLQQHGIPCGSVYSLRDALEAEEFKQQRFFNRINHPDYDKCIPQPANPVRFMNFELNPPMRPPRCGEQNAEILHGLGFDSETISAMYQESIIYDSM